jgi:hypothetical protein
MMRPDDFADDPYAHVTNQAGHAAFVGMPIGLVLAWLGWPLWAVPLVVAMIYGAAWEWGWQRTTYPTEFDWRDSLMDTACVMAGASMVAGFLTDLPTGAACWLAWAVLVLWGGLRRWK